MPISVPRGAWVTLGTLNLPAGNYIAMASLYFPNDSGASGIAYCTVVFAESFGTPDNAQVIDSEAGGQAVSQALTTAGILTSPGTAKLRCTNNGFGGNLQIQTFNLNAIKVGSLTVQ